MGISTQAPPKWSNRTEIKAATNIRNVMRRFLASVLLLCLAAPSWGAGSIPVALNQQFSAIGAPLVNCQLFTYVVGTVATPQTAFQDTGLSQALPWPVTCDANGRLPMFYLADGSVHVRLTDSSGIVQFDYPSMLVIGPSSGGGGGSTVDPTTIASTGDIKFRPTSEFVSGWVKLNGQTIGSATSGASGRANSDTQNLFVYLWTNCTNAHCPVGGGRGATALADFAANKQLTLPDWRARIPVGLDDMGNTPAGILQAKNVTSGGGDGVTTPGATGGEAVHTLLLAEAPTGQFTMTDPGHSHTLPFSVNTVTGASGASFPSNGTSAYNTGTSTTGITLQDHAGGGNHNVMNPFMLGTWYLKL
jgi:hypothetical protein